MPRSRPLHGSPIRSTTLLLLVLVALAAIIALGLLPRPAHGGDAPPALTGTLWGIVVSDTGRVAFATVMLTDSKQGAMCDEHGIFRIDRVPAGQHVLRAIAIGCRPHGDTLEVHAGRVDSVLVTLTDLLETRYGPKRCPRPAAECMEPNPDQQARIGRRCERHRDLRLVADTVIVMHGLIVTMPGFTQAQRDSFPNAFTSWPGGCVITPDDRPWTEVAYCPACRAAQSRWRHRATPGTEPEYHRLRPEDLRQH